jgi:hypothetical protein
MQTEVSRAYGILVCFCRSLALCIGIVCLIFIVQLLGGCQRNHSESTYNYRSGAGIARPGKPDLPTQFVAFQPEAEIILPELQNVTADVLPEVAKRVIQLEQKGQGRKLIAVTLYGSDPRYTQGAVENAMLARRDWLGWTYRVYFGAGVPAETLDTIQVCHVRGEEQGAWKALAAVAMCWQADEQWVHTGQPGKAYTAPCLARKCTVRFLRAVVHCEMLLWMWTKPYWVQLHSHHACQVPHS